MTVSSSTGHEDKLYGRVVVTGNVEVGGEVSAEREVPGGGQLTFWITGCDKNTTSEINRLATKKAVALRLVNKDRLKRLKEGGEVV